MDATSTVLVTGASGFAGSHLIDLLAADHADVVAWRRPGGGIPAARRGVRWDEVDLIDAAQVRAGIDRARPSAVYHCAGAAHVGRSFESTESTFAANVMATHHLV